MWQDVRQALRTLRKHPAFVCLAALVLALGIALNTAIFSIVYALLFKPLPVASPGELVSLYFVTSRQPDRPWPLPDRAFTFLSRHNDAFTGLTAHWGLSYTLRADDEADIINAEWVISNYFDVLGVKPAFGRPLLPAEDDVSNPERAVVISHALWTGRFKADPRIVGKQITLVPFSTQVDMPVTVVGVMAPDFKGISDPWKPTHVWMTFAQGLDLTSRSRFSGVVIGRLKSGVSFEQARAMVETQGPRAMEGFFAPGIVPRIVAYRTNDVRMPFDPSAALIPARLAGAMTIVVAMVLLVAATNIAGILMARGVGRSGEIAVRRVLGAGAVRIVRQLLAESLLLSVAGGLLGFVLAGWLVTLFRTLTPIQFAFDVTMDSGVVLFTTAVCVLAGFVVGIMPAKQAIRLDVLPWLQGSGAVQTRQTRRRLRHAITLPQVACSLMLLLVAGVYVRGLLRVELADSGYQVNNLLVANPSIRLQPGERPYGRKPDPHLEERYAARTRRFYYQLLERLRAMPGAADVAIASSLPLREPPARANWSVVSQEDFDTGERQGPGTERSSVSPGFFRTMQIALVAGREFDERDTRTTPKVAVIGASVAGRLWPGRDAIGRTLTLLNAFPADGEKNEFYQVVGVVRDVAPVLHQGARAFVYLPLGQEWRPWTGHVLVRGHGDSRTLIPAVKNAVASSDPMADVRLIRTMAQLVADILYPRRIAAAILGISGVVALCLATLGVYGVIAYSVAQRTGEIGVRMALGAERRDIIRLVVGEGATVAAIGSTAGVLLGYVAMRVTSSRYLALPQLDVLIMLAMPLVLTAAVLLACYAAARRAGSLDPMDVLRRT
jgi:predicted permease